METVHSTNQSCSCFSCECRCATDNTNNQLYLPKEIPLWNSDIVTSRSIYNDARNNGLCKNKEYKNVQLRSRRKNYTGNDRKGRTSAANRVEHSTPKNFNECSSCCICCSDGCIHQHVSELNYYKRNHQDQKHCFLESGHAKQKSRSVKRQTNAKAIRLRNSVHFKSKHVRSVPCTCTFCNVTNATMNEPHGRINLCHQKFKENKKESNGNTYTKSLALKSCRNPGGFENLFRQENPYKNYSKNRGLTHMKLKGRSHKFKFNFTATDPMRAASTDNIIKNTNQKIKSQEIGLISSVQRQTIRIDSSVSFHRKFYRSKLLNSSMSGHAARKYAEKSSKIIYNMPKSKLSNVYGDHKKSQFNHTSTIKRNKETQADGVLDLGEYICTSKANPDKLRTKPTPENYNKITRISQLCHTETPIENQSCRNTLSNQNVLFCEAKSGTLVSDENNPCRSWKILYKRSKHNITHTKNQSKVKFPAKNKTIISEFPYKTDTQIPENISCMAKKVHGKRSHKSVFMPMGTNNRLIENIHIVDTTDKDTDSTYIKNVQSTWENRNKIAFINPQPTIEGKIMHGMGVIAVLKRYFLWKKDLRQRNSKTFVQRKTKIFSPKIRAMNKKMVTDTNIYFDEPETSMNYYRNCRKNYKDMRRELQLTSKKHDCKEYKFKSESNLTFQNENLLNGNYAPKASPLLLKSDAKSKFRKTSQQMMRTNSDYSLDVKFKKNKKYTKSICLPNNRCDRYYILSNRHTQNKLSVVQDKITDKTSFPRNYVCAMNMKSSNGPRKLHSYECEPGICIPHECEPNQCQKIILGRLAGCSSPPLSPIVPKPNKTDIDQDLTNVTCGKKACRCFKCKIAPTAAPEQNTVSFSPRFDYNDVLDESFQNASNSTLDCSPCLRSIVPKTNRTDVDQDLTKVTCEKKTCKCLKCKIASTSAPQQNTVSSLPRFDYNDVLDESQNALKSTPSCSPCLKPIVPKISRMTDIQQGFTQSNGEKKLHRCFECKTPVDAHNENITSSTLRDVGIQLDTIYKVTKEKNCDQVSQSSKSMLNNTTNVLKRCFCTLKLKKQGSEKTRIITASQHAHAHINPLSGVVNVNKVKSYGRVPNSKTVTPSLLKHCFCKFHNIETGLRFQKTAAVDKNRKVISVLIPPKGTTTDGEFLLAKTKNRKCTVKHSRSAVCIKSNISVNIDFFKDRPQCPRYMYNEHKNNNYSSARDLITKTNNSDLGLLRRCLQFCTLKFQKISKSQQKLNSNNIKTVKNAVTSTKRYETFSVGIETNIKPYKCEQAKMDKCLGTLISNNAVSRHTQYYNNPKFRCRTTQVNVKRPHICKTTQCCVKRRQTSLINGQKYPRSKIKPPSCRSIILDGTNRKTLGIRSSFSFNIDITSNTESTADYINKTISETAISVPKRMSSKTKIFAHKQKCHCKNKLCNKKSHITCAIKKCNPDIGGELLSKRCFCTLDLKKKELQEFNRFKTDNEQVSTKRKYLTPPSITPNNRFLTGINSKCILVKGLRPYECEPYVCIPDQGDVRECFDRVKKRRPRHRCMETNTKSSQTNACTMTTQHLCQSKMIQCEYVKKKCMKTEYSSLLEAEIAKRSHLTNISCSKQAIRISSKFSFSVDVGFSKEHLPSQNHNIMIENYSDATCNKQQNALKENCNGNNVTISYTPTKLNSHLSQSEICNSKNEVTGQAEVLTKCSCTLNIFDDNNILYHSVTPECRVITVGRVDVEDRKFSNLYSDNIYTKKLSLDNCESDHVYKYLMEDKLNQLSSANDSSEMKTIFPYVPNKFHRNKSKTLITQLNQEILLNRTRLSSKYNWNKNSAGKVPYVENLNKKRSSINIVIKNILHRCTHFFKTFKLQKRSSLLNFHDTIDVRPIPRYTKYKRVKKRRHKTISSTDILKTSKSDRRRSKSREFPIPKISESQRIAKLKKDQIDYTNRRPKVYSVYQSGDAVYHNKENRNKYIKSSTISLDCNGGSFSSHCQILYDKDYNEYNKNDVSFLEKKVVQFSLLSPKERNRLIKQSSGRDKYTKELDLVCPVRKAALKRAKLTDSPKLGILKNSKEKQNNTKCSYCKPCKTEEKDLHNIHLKKNENSSMQYKSKVPKKPKQNFTHLSQPEATKPNAALKKTKYKQTNINPNTALKSHEQKEPKSKGLPKVQQHKTKKKRKILEQEHIALNSPEQKESKSKGFPKVQQHKTKKKRKNSEQEHIAIKSHEHKEPKSKGFPKVQQHKTKKKRRNSEQEHIVPKKGKAQMSVTSTTKIRALKKKYMQYEQKNSLKENHISTISETQNNILKRRKGQPKNMAQNSKMSKILGALKEAKKCGKSSVSCLCSNTANNKHQLNNNTSNKKKNKCKFSKAIRRTRSSRFCDACDYSPMFEMKMFSESMSILNKGEILDKIRKLKIRRSSIPAEELKFVHGKSCQCCICKSFYRDINNKSASTTPKKCRFWKKAAKNPCICGSQSCIREVAKQAALVAREKAAKKRKPCICGTKICEKESVRMDIQNKLITPSGGKVMRKNLKKKAKDKKKQRRLEEKAALAQKKEKLHQKEYKLRQKRYKVEDALRHKKQKKDDKYMNKQNTKYLEADGRLLAAESLRDIGLIGIRGVTSILRAAGRAVIDPKQHYRRLQEAMKDPIRTLSNAKSVFSDLGVSSAAKRLKGRVGAMPCIYRIKDTLEQNAFTNFLVHIFDRNPKGRLKKRRRRRVQLDFECSLFMASMRKKPWLCVYYMCPWFYLHFISLLNMFRQFMDVLIFILAVAVWSPLLLIMELCRTCMCCTLCTG